MPIRSLRLPFKAPLRERPEVQPIGEIIRENVFAPYRKRIVYPAAGAGAVVILPLAVHHLLERSFALGVLMLLLVAMLAVDAAAIRRGREPPVPMAVLLIPAVAGLAIGLPTHGLYGALWTFPTLMFAYFALRRRLANIVAAAMLAVGTALLFVYQGGGMAIRFLVALGLCVIIVNILLDVLDSLQARIIAQSVTDLPTGAFNRRHLENCLAHVLERHRRTGAIASILLLDIDRFSRVNDRLGVDGGDRVLRAFTDVVRSRVREQDLVFRCGGQKFAVLLPDMREGEATLVAEQLRAAVAGGSLVEGQELTVSVGVSQLRTDDAAEPWLRRGNAALRNAKDEGRNRVMVAA